MPYTKVQNFLDMERFHDTLEVKLVVSVRDNIVLIAFLKANYQFAYTNIKLFYLHANNFLIKNKKAFKKYLMNKRNSIYRESIGHKLKEYRLKNFLSIDDIIFMTKISKSSVVKVEKGTAKDIDLYVEYAKAVQYPLATLTDFKIPLKPLNKLPKDRLERVNLTAKIREHIVKSNFLIKGKTVSEIKDELVILKLVSNEITSVAVAGVMRNLNDDGLVATGNKVGRKVVYFKKN